MVTRHWKATTSANRDGQIPAVNDRIVVDGIPGDVTKVDEFHGIEYQVMIPGLVVDGKQQFVVSRIPWETLVSLREMQQPADESEPPLF